MNDVVGALRDGGVVVIPTDTVYGIACLPRLDDAVRTIFSLKGRPDDKPLPVLGDGIGALEAVATFDERATELARRFWPGPLTLVLPRTSGFTYDLGGGDVSTVAVRVPHSGVTFELLSQIGPLATTSANRSGSPPATSIAEAQAIFGDEVAAYVDGGPCRGLPSTVLSLVGPPRVLREGALTPDEVLVR